MYPISKRKTEKILSMTILLYIILILAIFNTLRIVISTLICNLNTASNIRKKRLFNKKNKLSNTLVTVIIPAYNEESTIEKAIISSLKNDYQYKEIIAINDGSTDNTPQILQKLKNKYSDLIAVNQKNLGKALALNNVIKNYAKGDLIMVLDGDSILHHFSH